MKTLTEMTENLVAEEQEFMNHILKQVTIKNLCDAGDDDIKMLRNTIKLLNAANDVIVEQARVLDEMNKKLNLLLIKEK